VEPYYDHSGITIYHADCRDVLPLPCDVVVTDPPYPNSSGHFTDDIAVAIDVLRSLSAREILCFWSEICRPPIGLPLVAVHIWHRTNVNGKPYEPVYHYAADKRKRRSDVLRGAAIFDGAGPGCNEYLGHPTQKPVHLMTRLLVKTAGLVLDPFCGSGSTLRAAKDLGRRAIGIEIEERYCEIAAERLSQEVLPL